MWHIWLSWHKKWTCPEMEQQECHQCCFWEGWDLPNPEGQTMVQISWHKSGIPSHSWSNYTGWPQMGLAGWIKNWQVPSCHTLREMVVHHLCLLLQSMHSSCLASTHAHTESSKQAHWSLFHLLLDWKSVLCLWSLSSFSRISRRFCCI